MASVKGRRLRVFVRTDPAVDVELSTVAAAITDVELRVCLRTTFWQKMFRTRTQTRIWLHA